MRLILMTTTHPYSKLVLWIFLVVSVLDVIGVSMHNSWLQLIFKPLIIPSLALLYYVTSTSKNRWYLAALLFSFLGDVLLLDKSNLFLFGIAAFLITQLLYIFIISKDLTVAPLKTKLTSAIPFSIFFIILIDILKPGLGDFLIPVVIYGLAISVFGTVSLLNYLLRKDQRSLTLLTGAILFIMSDSMIALHKFYEAENFYPVAIMITYVVAQYLIFGYMRTPIEKSVA
jgi:uncharacterized membrane protein YhhN